MSAFLLAVCAILAHAVYNTPQRRQARAARKLNRLRGS